MELSGEIRAHLECAEEDALRRGLSREQARNEARRLFGGIEQIKEEHRDNRGVPLLETLFRDLRHGIASLRRVPGFAFVILGILALGIGGTIAMFSIVDAVLLKPLPFPEPDRIVRVWEAPRPGVVNATTVAQFLAWKHLGTAFDAMAAEQQVSGAFYDSNGPVRLSGKLVTAEYFKVFGVTTAFGRTFAPQEDQPGAAPVLVLSYSAWQTDFGADPDILHHTVILDGSRCQIIGVLQPGAFDRDETKFWRPLIFTPDQTSSPIHLLSIYGRLRSDWGLAQAQQQMRAIYAALLPNSLMDENRTGNIEVERLSTLLTSGNLRHSIVIAFGAVLLVLLITCANVANLLFARGAARKAELAVRAALGAGRARLVSQLLTECLALCLLGGAAGLAFAYFLIRLATPLLAETLPFTATVTINLSVLIFTGATVVAVALITGALPALEALRGDFADTLKQTSRVSSAVHIRVRRAIVIGEVALSLVLVSGALLLTRSLIKLEQLDTGVQVENVITASIHLPQQAYPTPEKAALFYQALSERLRSTPGIAQAGMSTFLPLRWISNGEGIFVPGIAKQVLVRCKRVDAGYFRTLGIPVLSGRGISDRDRQGSARIVVINQALAGRLADVARVNDPVGKMVRLTSADYLGKQPLISEVQIAGVVRNERTAAPGLPEPPVVYVPLAQSPSGDIKLVIRSKTNQSGIIAGVRRALQTVDPNLPLADVATLQQIRDDTLSGVSRPAWLIGAFAVIAILLSAIGLYGVMSYSVAQRRVELGIRIALGARSRDVLSYILRSAFGMVLAGLAIGMIGVYAVTRTLGSFLFEVSPLDPSSLALACLATTAIGLLAGFFPARRAAHIDPAVSLRDGG
jgi:predicted permease